MIDDYANPTFFQVIVVDERGYDIDWTQTFLSASATMKKVDFKKTLVRNTEEKPKKTTVITDHSNTGSSKVCSASKSEEVVPKLDLNKGNSTDRVKMKQTKFDTPELQSTMKLSKRIDEIVKPRKTKSCSDVDKQKLAVDEKVDHKI